MKSRRSSRTARCTPVTTTGSGGSCCGSPRATPPGGVARVLREITVGVRFWALDDPPTSQSDLDRGVGDWVVCCDLDLNSHGWQRACRAVEQAHMLLMAEAVRRTGDRDLADDWRFRPENRHKLAKHRFREGVDYYPGRVLS